MRWPHLSSSTGRVYKCIGRDSLAHDSDAAQRKKDVSNVRWWRMEPRIDPQLSRALSMAKDGLQRLSCGCSLLKSFDFPNEDDITRTVEALSSALEIVRTGLQSLEDIVQEAVDWQKRCPNGGRLLQRRMCFAAKDSCGPLDTSGGRLCLGTHALSFESHDSPQWHFGPIRLEEVERLERCEDGHLRLRVGGAGTGLLISGTSQADWFHQLEDLVSDARKQIDSDSFCTAIMSTTELPSVHALAARSENLDAWLDSYSAYPRQESSAGNALTASFYRVADQVRPAETPQRQEPVYAQAMPEISLDLVHRALYAYDESWPPQIYLEQEMNGHLLKATPWAVSKRVQGTQLRRLQFRMPVPDVPKAVRKLIRAPDDTAVTLLFRFHSSEENVVLVQEIQLHDVTFGENFSVVEVMSFTGQQDGGVLFEKYVDVRWFALPWYANVVKMFVEMKARKDGKSSVSFWTRYLNDKCSASLT